MKINNMTLILYNTTLSTYGDKILPQKISYAITKNMMIISNELEPYRKSLQKILDNYKDDFIFDENGETVLLDIGIPKVNDIHTEEYLKEINELLQIETDVILYYIDEKTFDYDNNGKYDPMSAKDIIMLREILCEGDINEISK